MAFQVLFFFIEINLHFSSIFQELLLCVVVWKSIKDVTEMTSQTMLLKIF